MSLPNRLRRHLSFANLVACLALFVALGGSAYAASQINGNKIVKHSIGGGKLKNETITSKQVKKNSLNSSVIDLSTLATVPSAQSAVTATSAGSANTANTATSAKTAESATTANTATTASSAETATTATNAEHASSADTAGHATSADTATEAGHAATAGDADTVEGKTAAELTDVCPTTPPTELFGGMCWDQQPRPQRTWIAAASECAVEEGRLPSISELVAYIAQDGEQAPTPHWSSNVTDLVSGEDQVLTASESGREIKPGGIFTNKYRCLFYRTNAG
jgi:hypothetical protein